MKKLLFVVFGGLLTLSFACQKAQDVPQDVQSAAFQADEILSCSGGGGTPPPTLECGQFRTQSQGGWGSYPWGNNSGSYLKAHFSDAFPSGLTVGCDGNGYALHFTSTAAITEFLPASGTAAVLTGSATDPASRVIKNVLAGHVTALALSVGFDNFYDDFSPAEEKLGNLMIASGLFAGKSVSEFLSIANGTLGGCDAQYSPGVINQTASAINANFVDGRTNGGFLMCPVSRLGR